MTPLFARGISTLKEPLRGVHLLWNGPADFLFAPGGWEIERKPAGDLSPHNPPTCTEVSTARLATLRNRLELSSPLGWIRLTPGIWPGPESGDCEVFTLEMDETVSGVSGIYRGRHGLAVGLNNGKAVGFQFLFFATDGRAFDFGQTPIDKVIVYGLRADAVRWCVSPELRWRGGEVIARLQLPLGEYSPDLDSDVKEFAEAKSRLITGETIDNEQFANLANIMRVALTGPGRRPIDNLLFIKTVADDPEQMYALDPLRTLLVSPKWRRVMGLAYVDRDVVLTVGDSYDYKITGFFPRSELDKRVFGFHTIVPGTVLPDHFLIEDCLFRLPNPVAVRAAPSIPASGDQWATRSGIPIEPANALPWIGFGIDEFNLCIDLPQPVESVILELDEDHALKFVAGPSAGPILSPKPVPAGSRSKLDFPTPITKLCLIGEGFLFAVRLSADDSDSLVPVSTVLQSVKFEESPLPIEPTEVQVENLQKPQGPSFTNTLPTVRALHVPGINVEWRPAPAQGVFVWPGDLEVSIPLDAAMFNVERRVDPSGSFTPVLSGNDNLMLGSRAEVITDRVLLAGMDIMSVYPEIGQPGRGSDNFSYTDTFQEPTNENPSNRNPPPPGTILRYRVRTVDAIGRSSENWRESDNVRLEKHEPPPPPAAFDPVPADQLETPDFTGVYAKILVKGSAELTVEESTLLGNSDNAIVLRWGWHEAERRRDPFATEFRAYLSETFDVLPAEILSASEVTASPGDVLLEVSVSTSIKANGAAGLSLYAGYPFYIVEHTGGTLINMLIRTRIPDATGAFRVPAPGAVAIPLKLSPVMTQPKTWKQRFVFPSGESRLPITSDTQYQAVIRDRLLLSVDHPRDSLWVGVSSADSEAYVDDKFPMPGPDGSLVGNESPVVAVRCDGRRAFRPEFSAPLPAGPVPRLLTPEPTDAAPVNYLVDLSPHILAAGLVPGEMVQPERVSVSELFGTLSVSGTQLLAQAGGPRNSDQPATPVLLANPDDQASVIAAVQSRASEQLEDRLAVRLAAIHPYASTLFQSATPSAVPFSAFKQTLPADEARYLYRFRRADSFARVSVEAAVVNAVVRVPSLQPGASPRQAPLEDGDPATRLRLRIPGDSQLSDVLVFKHAAGAGREKPVTLMRVGNRPELGADMTIRLRRHDGTVLEPVIHSLTEASEDAQGWVLSVDVAGQDGEVINVWASTLTVDGIPSPPGGPWKVFMPEAALTTPALDVAASGVSLRFTWTLPDPVITHSWLEVSDDGNRWARASSIRKSPDAFTDVADQPGERNFRAVVASQDGRRSFSNTIVV